MQTAARRWENSVEEVPCPLGDDFPEGYRGGFVVARFGNLLERKKDAGFDLLPVRRVKDGKADDLIAVRSVMKGVARPVDLHLSRKGKVYICEYSRQIENKGYGGLLPGRVLELSTGAVTFEVYRSTVRDHRMAETPTTETAVRTSISRWPRLSELAEFAVRRHGYGDTDGGFGVTYPADLDEYDRMELRQHIPSGKVMIYGFWGLPDGYEVLIEEAVYLATLAAVLTEQGLLEESERVRALLR